MRGSGQNILSDFIASVPCVKDADGELSDFAFAGVLNPREEVVGLIELEGTKDLAAEERPATVPIVVIHDGLQRAQPDFVSTSFVTQDMSPASDLNGFALRGFSKATGASATENEDLIERGKGGSGEQGCIQVVSDGDGNSWPSGLSGLEDSLAIR